MGKVVQFQVQQKDVSQTRWTEADEAELVDGQVRLAVDEFAFTANNVTYAVIGDQFGYWRFFPVRENGWGIIPVWGFADVVASRHPEISEGERLYGYLPMATQLTVTPGDVRDDQFTDITAHRRELPAVYNVLMRLKGDPRHKTELEPYRALWFPLAGTSFGLADWLTETAYQEAKTVLLVSASSKTGLALAYLLSRRRPHGISVAGLTSPANKAAVEKIGYYDTVLSYADAESLNAFSPTVIVDFSGNGATLARLHRHLGENMKHTVIVGASHWDEERKGEGYIEERSRLFFMPAYAIERAKATSGKFISDMYDSNYEVAQAASGWMQLVQADTQDGIDQLYRDVKDGKLQADQGGIMSLAGI